MKQVWTVRVSMRDAQDDESEEIGGMIEITGRDADWIGLKQALAYNTLELADRIVRYHRLVTVGEE